MSLQDIYRPVRAEMELVEQCLQDCSRCEDESISKTVAQILGAGGKRLRPALLLMAARSCGCSADDRAIKLAAAVEFIHTASLVHDDVIDGAGTRRGTPTVNSQWGDKAAVLLGDYLSSKAIDLLTRDGDLEVIRSVAAATLKMTQSETVQTLLRNRPEVTEDQYFSIIDGKTASLLACACRVGALLAAPRNGEVEALTDCGRNLGMTFQITDDLLDLFGEEARTGKALGSDVREGRLTLPMIHAMRSAGEADARWMAEVIRSGQVDAGVLDRIRELVTRHRGVEYSLRKAREYSAACKERLMTLAESESRTSLVRLADHVVERAC